MKWFTSAAAVVLAAGLAAGQGAYVYSDPCVPPRDVLARLNLRLGWSAYVPMDGTRDGFFSVQLSGKDLFVQTRSGLLACLDAETGRTVWRARLGNPYRVRLPLGFNNLTVFSAVGGTVYALDRATGQTRWEIDITGALTAPPVADEEQLYLCFDTGKVNVYYLPTASLSPRGVAVQAGPAAAGAPGVLVPEGLPGVADFSIRVKADVRTGPVQLFDYLPGVDLERAPVVTSEYLVLPGVNGEIVVSSKFLGRELYRFPTGAGLSLSLNRYEDVAYVAGDDQFLYALDLVARRPQWRFTTGMPLVTPPIVTDTYVYIVAADRGLYRLDRDTGREVWRLPPGDPLRALQPPCFASPIWAEGRVPLAHQFLAVNPKFLYALDRSGRLLVLDQKRGTPLSGLPLRGFTVGYTNEVNDRIYLGANSGLLMSLHDRDYPTPLVIKRDRTSGIDALLERRVNREAIAETPLAEVMELLTDLYDLPIEIDEKAFAAAGNPNIKMALVQLRRRDRIAIGELLQEILDQVQATFRVERNKVVVIPGRPKR